MKKALTLITLIPLITLLARGEGFTDADVLFYGKVHQASGAQSTLLQAGKLEVTLVNQSDAANVVKLTGQLRPTGTGERKAYSYAMRVPLKFLPDANQKDRYLSIGAAAADFRIQNITIDGREATLPDGSKEYYGLSFASRAEQYRLDLLVGGSSTDSDGDGLPDWWESLHGLDPNAPDADGDLDGDGWSNGEEFRRGSDPGRSNRVPQLATTTIQIPEQGRAGCYLRILDSDTSANEIQLQVDDSELTGFTLSWGGFPVRPANWPALTLAHLQSGQLTITHDDPAVAEASLGLSWHDGGEPQSGNLFLKVARPSTADGNDASLWLDAASLPAGPLASWSDRSGNGRAALQPVPANRPRAAFFSHLRTVRFAENQHLFFQDEALPASSHTVLAAWRSRGSRKEAQVVFSSNRGFLRLDPTAEAVSYPGAPRYQADGIAVRGYQSTLGATTTSIFRREGEILQNIFGLSYNGESIAAETLDPVLPTLGARRLALPVADPVVEGFQGDLHELLVFPTALPEQKLRDVHDYLNSKWRGYVTWDFSTELSPVALTETGPGRHIIRGGHGADSLRGGAEENILSGGPGDDLLHAGPGRDTFVFGGVDTGRDSLIAFDPVVDTIDLSALFWGQSGDARAHLTTRLDTNFSTPVPTLDTVLIVAPPEGPAQEIVLRDTVLGSQQIIEMIVEGRIQMGSLSIPTTVKMALAADSKEERVLTESLEDSFTVEITRSGEGTAGALDVPLGMFQDALGKDFALEGATTVDGQRAIVQFARGESMKRVTFRPLPDLESEGTEHWEATVLPHYRYQVNGGTVARSVRDKPNVRLVVVEANAFTTGQVARVRVERDGATEEPLVVGLSVQGTAEEGVHIQALPRTVTIPAGRSFQEITIATLPGWSGTPTRMALLRALSREHYLVGSPHEATIFAARSAAEVEGAGFGRWLTAVTEGKHSNLIELLKGAGAARVNDYLQAYAFGTNPDRGITAGLSVRLVDGRPELSTRARPAADLRWQVQASEDAREWQDVSAEFVHALSEENLTLLGSPVRDEEKQKLYRLSFSLESGSQVGAGLRSIAGDSRFGMDGVSWQSDPRTGHLTTSEMEKGSVSRLIVEVKDPTLLDFEMAVPGGGEGDQLTFFIDGEQVASTGDAAVGVRRKLTPDEPVLLMWEFRKGTGTPLISDLPLGKVRAK